MGIGALISAIASGLGSVGSAIGGGLGAIGADLGLGGAGAAATGVADAGAGLAGLGGSLDAGAVSSALDAGAAAAGLGGAGAAAAGLGGAAAGAGAGAAAGAGLGGVLSGIGSVAPALTSGIGLVGSVLSHNKKPPGYNALASSAANLSSSGQQLSNYLASGTLPPGVSAGLQTAHDNAAATIRSQYAARGQSGSSAEQEDLANLASTTVSKGASIASSLLQQGVSQTQLADQIYAQLMNYSIQQDSALSGSIGNFAGALAKMGSTSPTPQGG